MSSSEQALIAAMTGAHAIIVQGKGSGGYTFPTTKEEAEALVQERDRSGLSGELVSGETRRKRSPLSTLIPACVEAISALNMECPPLIIAAGGITTGADISHCLNLGADAVCVSTVHSASVPL